MLKMFLIAVGAVLLIAALLIGGFLIQSARTAADIEQEWQTARIEPLRNLGTTRTLEILPLFEEAAARDNLEAEHGVSYLVKTDSQNVLLDVGMTPTRLTHNMQVLGIDEKDFDTVFITHLHPDHLGGTDAWWSNTLAPGAPPLNLQNKRVYVPLAISNPELQPIIATQRQKIANGVASIGAIAFPELFPLSLKSMRNVEQVLAVNVQDKGIVLITGCGHPTIERIVARAQQVFDEPIVGIVGGLHYEGFTREQTEPHITFVKQLKPQLVALSPHDSSPAAIQAFRDAFAGVYQEIAVGRAIVFGKSPTPIVIDSSSSPSE